jgi:hypothetical protein
MFNEFTGILFIHTVMMEEKSIAFDRKVSQLLAGFVERQERSR